MQDVSHGAERSRIWPRHRKRRRDKDVVAREEKFRAANMATKYIAPQTLREFTDAVKGTPLLPRDLLLMQFYQRLVAFIMPDGKKVYPMPAKIDVSAALDVLSQTPGSTLRRGEEYWAAAPPPANVNLQFAIATRDTQMALPSTGLAFRGIPLTVATYDPDNWIDPVAGGFRPPVPGWYLLFSRIGGASNVFRNGGVMVDGVHQRGGAESTATGRGALIIATPVVTVEPAQLVQADVATSAAGTVNPGSDTAWAMLIGPLMSN